ncbi:MAG: RHS repeat-associated core domain-containing protein, partial [Pseudomonadota bacterium]
PSVHHFYDSAGGVVYRGDGTRQDDGGSPLIHTFGIFGGQGDDSTTEGLPATQVQMTAEAIAVASDGTVYYGEPDDGFGEYRIRKVDPEGIVTTVIPFGGEDCPNPEADASDFRLNGALSSSIATRALVMTVDPQDRLVIGSVFCEDFEPFEEDGESFFPYMIYRLEHDGTLKRLVGTEFLQFGPSSFPNSELAEFFELYSLEGIDYFPDGTLAILENSRLYRLQASGLVDRFAGLFTCLGNCDPDGTPAIDAGIELIFDMATLPDGGVVIAGNQRDSVIRKITADGLLQTLLPAEEEVSIFNIEAGPDGVVYAVTTSEDFPFVLKLIAIDPDGTTRVIAGGEVDQPYASEGGPARQQRFDAVDIALGPEGAIYGATFTLTRIEPGDTPVPLGDTLVASNQLPEVYRFAANGRHIETRHALTDGVLWQFGYDDEGRLISVTDSYGNATTISRNGSGEPTGVVGPDSHTTSFTLDSNRYLATATSPGGAVARFSYDAGGLLQTVTTPTDDTYTMAYDALGRLASVTDPMSQTQTLARQEIAGGYEVTHTSATGLATRYVRTVDSDRTVTSTTTHPDGRQLVTRAESDGRVTQLSGDGVMLDMVLAPDPRFAMQSPYPAEASILFPGGTTETRSQTRTATLMNTGGVLDLASLTNTITVGSDVTTYAYNGDTREETLTTPTGRSETHGLDAFGSLLRREGSGMPTIQTELDGRGRIQRLRIGEGQEERVVDFSYGANGQLASAVDPLLQETLFRYDADLRPIEVESDDGAVTAAAFDAGGFEIGITQPDGVTRIFVPDSRQSLVQTIYPDAGSGTTQTDYAVDNDRRAAAETRADGDTLTATYDSQGRNSTLSYSRGQLTFSHDADSARPLTLTSPDAVLTRTYDGAWLAQEVWSGGLSGSVERVLATDRVRRASETVNGQDPITYSYTPLLTAVGALSLTRDVQTDDIASATLGQVAEAYQYDSEGRLDTYTASIGGTPYLAYDLSYDALSRVAGVEETLSGTDRSTAVTYNARGFLDTVTVDGTLAATYGFDARGNRTSVTQGATTTAATYNAQDQQLTLGTVQLTFDADGTLTSRTDGGDVTTYSYDEFSNLVQVVLGDGRVISYGVDAAHRRVWREVDGVRSAGYLHGDRNRIVAELDADDNVVSRFVYAAPAGAPAYLLRGGVTYRYVRDHLGSVRAVVNATSGAVVQAIEYDVWGAITSDSNPGFQPFAFAGGLYDPLTGLTRFGARDYLAETGRFTTRDPLGLGGGDPNLYLYVRNSPLTSTDESGLVAPVLVAALLGLGAAAVSENSDSFVGAFAANRAANVATGGNTLVTAGKDLVAAGRARSGSGAFNAIRGSSGGAAPFFLGGKFLGWGARQAGDDSFAAGLRINAENFGIDTTNLTVGEREALRELIRTLRDSDGTNIDELNEAASRLAALKQRANARRKGL